MASHREARLVSDPHRQLASGQSESATRVPADVAPVRAVVTRGLGVASPGCHLGETGDCPGSRTAPTSAGTPGVLTAALSALQAARRMVEIGVTVLDPQDAGLRLAIRVG